MEWLVIIITILVILYGQRKNWAVLSIIWALSVCGLFLRLDYISIETLIMSVVVFLTFLPRIYYQLYFKNETPVEARDEKFISIITVGTVLTLVGLGVVVYKYHNEAISELLSANRLRTNTIFQFMEHYQNWGIALGCFVIFLFAMSSRVKNDGASR